METTSEDVRFMGAGLALGSRNLGLTAPNPCVAALVVRDGAVVARGVTAPGGRPHAETRALAAAGDAARGATLYVTLEPCSHYGRTPPCTEAIVRAGVARVVVATLDPDPRVAGRGIAQLRAAGIEVMTGVGECAAMAQHRGHFERVTNGRPAVTLKLAETRDGFAAGAPGDARLAVTGDEANAWVHMLRSLHDAVMVGAGTCRTDDPLLTVRLPGMEDHRPTRIVLDTWAAVRIDSRLIATAAEVPVLILTGPGADSLRVAALQKTGATVVAVEGGPEGLDPAAAMHALGRRGITRVLCEGGPRLGRALLDGGLVDEAVLLMSPEALGRPGQPALDPRSRALLANPDFFQSTHDRMLGRDRLRRFSRISTCSPG